MRSKTRFKAGIYFSHYECLGHISIVMAVGEVFKKRSPGGDLFFIQAGIQQPNIKINQLGKVYSLPGAFVSRQNFRVPVRQLGADVEKRGQVCVDIVTREKPDLFITEFFPLGWEECRHELISPLLKASEQGAAVWAVAGHPLLTGTNNEWRDRILKLYQKIIIFSPVREKELMAGSFKRASDKQKYLNFFERNAQKIIFAGYLWPQHEVVLDDEEVTSPKPPMPQGVCRVAVVRGGGAFYPKVVAEAIQASDLLGKEYHLTVVAGPATTTQEWYFFNALVAKKKVNNLLLLRSLGNYEGLVKDSDVCVAMGGYNTSVMLLKHRKKAVIIPFEGYGSMTFYEQPARAVLLKEMIGARILYIQELTANTLASEIRDTASRKKIHIQIPKEWFFGADVLDKALTGLF